MFLKYCKYICKFLLFGLSNRPPLQAKPVASYSWSRAGLAGHVVASARSDGSCEQGLDNQRGRMTSPDRCPGRNQENRSTLVTPH